MGFYPAVGWVGGFWEQVVGGSQLEGRKLSCVGKDGMTLAAEGQRRPLQGLGERGC